VDIMPGSFKSPLKPDERANLAFYCQVLRQVLPEELLDAAHMQERNGILSQYVSLYAARDYDLSQAGQHVWEAGKEKAIAEFPSMTKLKPGLQLTDAEGLYQFFTYTDLRQLRIEQHEMQVLHGNDLRKDSELAYPDLERLYEFSQVKAPMREYREGQILAGKRYMHTVLDAAVKEYGRLNNREDLRLRHWLAKPLDWQLVYWNDDPNSKNSKIQFEVHERFPSSLQCQFSNDGATLVKEWKEIGIFEADSGGPEKIKRMNELAKKAISDNNGKSCIHDTKNRRMDTIR